MTDADVIAAIRTKHLRANLNGYADCDLDWARATVDPGGTIFGAGPYLHVPVTREDIVIRVYAPERLRRRLAANWARTAVKDAEARK